MPENIRDIIYLIIALPFLAIFSNIVAIVALSPIIYFKASRGSIFKKIIALFIFLPVIWYMLFYGSIYGGQFLQNNSSIGMLAGAFVSISIVLQSHEKKWLEEIKWLSLLLIFGLPILGYIIGENI